MSEPIVLYSPEGETTVMFSPAVAEGLLKNGWTKEPPAKKEADATVMSEAVTSTPAPTKKPAPKPKA